jgi:SsrA-binding protein
LIGKVERAGYALLPLDLHYVRGRIKLEVGLARGKKQHDKRDDEQEKDAKREVQRAMKERQR